VKKRLRKNGTDGSGDLGGAPHPRTSKASRHTLVEKAIAGDEGALADLLEWVRVRAMRQVISRIQDPDEAEDVAQEVLIRVFRSLHTFRFQSRFSTWVFRIIENQLQSHFRFKASANRVEEKALLAHSNPHPACFTEVTVDAEKLRKTVSAAVERLPALQNRVFRLVALQAWEPCEAARALGKSQTNVRASLSRARGKIRELLLEGTPGLMRDLGHLEPPQAA